MDLISKLSPIGLAISAIFALGLYELGMEMWWAWRNGRPYAKELLSAIRRWRTTGFYEYEEDEFHQINARHGRRWLPDQFPITGWLVRISRRVRPRFAEKLAEKLFRASNKMTEHR